MKRASVRATVRDSRGGAGGSARSAEDGPKPGFAEEALPHLDAVHRFALRLARGDEARAEDLVQDTYLRAYRGWGTYARGTRCRSWLFTICRNVAVRHAEGKGFTMEHCATDLGVDDVTDLLAGAAAPQAADPEADFFDSLVDKEVCRAIDGLPREYRDAVVLCDLEGLGYDEIARRLGVAAGTIKSRIHRGRNLLREVLRPYAVEIGHLPAAAGSG